jgi:hypothetical protein
LGQIGQPLHLEQLIVKPLKYKHDAATFNSVSFNHLH